MHCNWDLFLFFYDIKVRSVILMQGENLCNLRKRNYGGSVVKTEFGSNWTGNGLVYRLV